MKLRYTILPAVLVIAALLVASSCLKEKAKVTVQVTVPPVGACDTITYTKHIKPIIDNNCATAGCHVAGAQFPPLTAYADVKDIATNGSLKLRVITLQNMPASAPLSQTDMNTIQCWLDNGEKQ